MDDCICNGGFLVCIEYLESVFLLYMLHLQVLALVGDQLEYGDNICGAVLSIRFNEDILSVWNRNSSDHQVNNYWLIFFFPSFLPCENVKHQPFLLCHIRL